ncbi:unnamed protein product [Lymnaea stagnalis]|uniref:Uncharacterized protein n=1 Tax=Lymnaea stagnalis TaxID=6523 RepID=A0AAV2HLJ8_LYMST
MLVLLVVGLTSYALGEKLKSLDEAIGILGELAGENLLIDPRDQENDVTGEAEETDDTLEKREHEGANTLAPNRAHPAVGRDTASLDHKLSAYNAFARKVHQASSDNKLSTHQASLDNKLSAYNAFARKAHQGVAGGKVRPDSDNWVFVEVPVGEDGDVIDDDTQSNRLAAYNALRRGDNRLAAYDGLRRGDNKLAAYDGLRRGDNRLAAYDGLRRGDNRLAAYDALRRGDNRLAAYDALRQGVGKAAAQVVPIKGDNKVAPDDALNKVAPHDAQKRETEEGNDVIKTKIVAFKV